MLAALVVYFLLGGGGASGPMLYMDAASERIEVAVTDEERKDTALELVDSMLDRSKDHNKALDGMREQLGDLVESYDVTEAELDALWDDYFDLDAQYTKEIIEMRFSLKDSLSREEWGAVFSAVSADTNTP